MKLITGVNDLATTCPGIAAEWDYERNGDLCPTDVTAGSNKKAYWLCKYGHSWEATICNRTRESGCPFCSGKRPIVGETDLATMYPEVAAEWDYKRNGNLRPTDVTAKSGKKVFWLCKHGHSWEAIISSRTHGNGCPYCSGRYPIVGETDLATMYPEVAAEWDYERNGDLRPTDLAAGSKRIVCWICAHGHSWKASIEHRTRGRGCPYCARKRPIVGETDLATLYPEVAAEWDYERNGNLRPTDVTAGSAKKVWWHCKRGHSWETTINDRTKGSACPYCMGKRSVVGETDLATKYPEIAAEWDYERNGNLRPTDVTAKSNKKVSWICAYGHSWEADISNRTKGSKCPYCAGDIPIIRETDLATTHPMLVNEWDIEKNGNLHPCDVTAGSTKKVWWRCNAGHSWEAVIYSRTGGNGCPYCSGNYPIIGETDLATINPALVEEWDNDKNGDLRPADVTTGSGKKVWWKCNRGHNWQAKIASRAYGSGCPICKGNNPHQHRS